MKTFSMARIKNIERKPVVFGMSLNQAIALGVISVMAIFYLLGNMSWTNFGITAGIIVGANVILRTLFALDLLKAINDQKLPDQIINTPE
jgi:hypothetical protein